MTLLMNFPALLFRLCSLTWKEPFYISFDAPKYTNSLKLYFSEASELFEQRMTAKVTAAQPFNFWLPLSALRRESLWHWRNKIAFVSEQLKVKWNVLTGYSVWQTGSMDKLNGSPELSDLIFNVSGRKNHHTLCIMSIQFNSIQFNSIQFLFI